MRVLAIHDGHNASACLLADGELQFAVQEERISRIKNHSTFPSLAIANLLEQCRLDPKEIDCFAFSSRHMPRNKDRRELMKEFRESSSLPSRLRGVLKKTPLIVWQARRRRKERLEKGLGLGFPRGRIRLFDHHTCHAAAAYYGSPFWRNEPVLVLTNDGGGDGLCATVSIGEGGSLRRIAAIPVSESIGYIYSMITFLLGMVPEEHEYKLMGMAPYSAREKHARLAQRFEELIEVDPTSEGLGWKRRNGCPPTQYSYRFFSRFIELERFDWVCGALQEFLEKTLTQWVRNCVRVAGIGKVALGGGVFMNVKLNKRIAELREVESLFVFPSCGDETLPMGAAFLAYQQESAQKGSLPDLKPFGPLYLGAVFDDREVRAELEKHSFPFSFREDIERDIARLLAAGEVVARFKGRMEFGSRALGNRSILADPSRREVVRTINEMIKNRDFWMPFAPSLLPDSAAAYLVNPKKIDSPYMIMSFDGRPETAADLAAASHPYDLTLRPQIVYESWNADYYRLMTEFRALTGRGAVLNTSFNLHGEPIAYTPKDALHVFMNSGLTHMGIGNYLVTKAG